MSAPEAPKGRLADLPLDERRTLDEAKQRELEDGFTRRHVQNARERDASSAANLARALKHGGG
jgi:hypothetical protein